LPAFGGADGNSVVISRENLETQAFKRSSEDAKIGIIISEPESSFEADGIR
jgi:hypothetical protein